MKLAQEPPPPGEVSFSAYFGLKRREEEEEKAGRG